MAYSDSTRERMDELRFRNQQSPRTDTTFNGLGLVSPPRNGTTRLPPPLQQQDARGGLMRRFTADSARVPTMSSLTLTTQRGGQEQDFGPSTYHKVQLLEKKKKEYEQLRNQKAKFEAEMQLLDMQQRKEERELAQMQEELGRNNSNAGHLSEPTTPPEYRDTNSGFPTVFSRPNRYSMSSLTSPPGLYNRPGRSGSQLTSPQAGIMQSRLMMDENARSIPGSRRNSDEDEKAEAVRQDPTSHRATNALNRYSMPVTKSRNGMPELLDQTGTTHFLFGPEDESATSPKHFMSSTEDNFPTLVRHDSFSAKQPMQLSASHAALDLAASQAPATDPNANGWSAFRQHRPSQQSLPMNTIQGNGSGSASTLSNPPESPISGRPSHRNSLDMKYYNEGQQDVNSQIASPSKYAVQSTPPKLQSSYSANDVTTMRSGANNTNGVANINTTPNSHAQQHLHNHNASLGRIPPNAMNNRLSRELSPTATEAQNGGFPSIQSALHASAPPFGPSLTQGVSPAQAPAGMVSPTAQSPYAAQSYYNPYNMHMMAMSMQNMQMSPQLYSPNNPYAYQQPPMYQSPGPVAVNGRFQDSQAKVIQQRRQNDGEAMNRFANMPLEQLGGEIYTLCKDQHGCRYLQKKLEERSRESVHMIWLETNQHVIELMTDPFGNYLCQKLLEYCNDNERTTLIRNAAPDLVRIALNQHGTRALQKMIEFITLPEQVDLIIRALQDRVVELIQDLNGNHVIQKCLNKLTPADATFIFEAVGRHCVDVGTHRHGCCVLQRCIDHAIGVQKATLIRQISQNATVLVQDPFGNYVVQYILDLNEPIFTEPLVFQFQGKVGQLSKQKFSSNVIEKCLRCANEQSKDMLIEEMLQPVELDRLLRDSFANYVIQTALDYANPTMKNRLIEAIRPHLPAIRTTPYGRRIQAKISGNEARNGLVSNGGHATTPNEIEPSQIPVRHLRGANAVTTAAFNGYVTPSAPTNGLTNGYSPVGNGIGSPTSQTTLVNGAFPSLTEAAPPQAYPYQQYGGAAPQVQGQEDVGAGAGAGGYF